MIKRLDNPVSAIAGQVAIEIVPAERSEQPPLPGQREPLTPGEDGCIHLPYRETTAGWQHPCVFIYLRNNSDRDLYCALLDMTDRFRCHSRLLLDGDHIPARRTAVAYEGRAIDISVPPGEPPVAWDTAASSTDSPTARSPATPGTKQLKPQNGRPPDDGSHLLPASQHSS